LFFKDITSPEIYRIKFFEFCDHYKDFSRLFTDDSKMGNQVAAAVVHGSVTKTTRLPYKSSVFKAELHAILLALAVIRRSKEKNFIIFSDSMSSLEAVSGFKIEIDIVQNITKVYTQLANSGKTIILCWIPSHVNIHGNERADTAAKSALSLPVNFYHASLISVLLNGKIYGTAVKLINFILFTPLLAFWSIAKIKYPVTIL